MPSFRSVQVHTFSKDFRATTEMITAKLLTKSASVRDFILGNYLPHMPDHIANLLKLIQEGKLKAGVGPIKFKDVKGIPEAFDHMYAKRDIGKLVVKLV